MHYMLFIAQQVGILLSLSKVARAHFLNLVFFSSNNENTYFKWIFLSLLLVSSCKIRRFSKELVVKFVCNDITA